ncbi:phosphocholine cytidylyltransferase family protein [Helicobacter trogontum]|uniref:CTP:phosphoglutamine cytidylyltransferase n=1 Tax=Helicobacter trogontum TaxID=50960 RepID=A0ABQ0D6R3_9HELI|nr:phosphocholine cytidylyltransferase family protein [Helicobacter trogontum]MDY5185591.1 phosphocholine cytidylyltransferase family protein [Helicobacter trogontum]
MKAIILAAGFGQRLMPLTQDVPKCMVCYKGRSIIDYILSAMSESGIKEVCIVGGYKFNVLREYINKTYVESCGTNPKNKIRQIRFYNNENYTHTNMVATLFCAKEFLLECIDKREDLLVSYADIIYFSGTVKKLISCNHDLGIIVDRAWKKLWSLRFSDPLSDAETLKLNGDKIVELGKKPKGYDEIEGQYIGLFKISHNFLSKVIECYENLDRKAYYDSKDFNNMYMTSFLQLLIDRYHNASMVEIFGNWCEIDFKSDLDIDFLELVL